MSQSPGVAHVSGDWAIQKLRARIPQDPFEVSIDGQSIGMTKLLAVARRRPDTERFPQVLVLYASGYLRLKTGADPAPPAPFGQSLVLGPAIWGTATSFPQTTLFFHPQIQRVAIATSPLTADGTQGLVIRVSAAHAQRSPGRAVTNCIMDLAWTLTLAQVSDHASTLAVAGRFELTEEVIPDPGKTAEAQSLRLLQISTMFIDRRRHDVDALRWCTSAGVRTLFYAPDLTMGLLPAAPGWLTADTPQLDSLQTDVAAAPNGPTPSYRMMIDATTGPLSGPLAVRAFLKRSRTQRDDNLGLWVYQQPLEQIAAGTTGSIDYRVIASSV